jgi:hypothetical protein
MFGRLWSYIASPWHRFQEKRRIKKRIEEMRKRDPFIY